jgi:regulator of replication initiation timing
MSTTEESILCSQIAILREQLVVAEGKIVNLTETVANLTVENKELKTKLQKFETSKKWQKPDKNTVFRK